MSELQKQYLRNWAIGIGVVLYAIFLLFGIAMMEKNMIYIDIALAPMILVLFIAAIGAVITSIINEINDWRIRGILSPAEWHVYEILGYKTELYFDRTPIDLTEEEISKVIDYWEPEQLTKDEILYIWRRIQNEANLIKIPH